MSTVVSDAGLQLAGGNLIDLRAAMPSTGSYTAGDLMIESSTGGRVSGWKRLTTGNNHVLGTDWVYFSDGAVLGTAVNTTSGTAIDFTGIPSWVKRITVMLNGVSTSGTSAVICQLGSGSVQTTGYSSAASNAATGNAWTIANFTTGIATSYDSDAARTRHGILTLATIGSNIWTGSSVLGNGAGASMSNGAGVVTLSGALDRIRLTTVNGTDTFDAGSVNILYE